MEFELRSTKTSVTMRGRQLCGLAAVYSTPASIRTPNGPFTEIIARGAFDGILKTNPDVICCVNHDPSLLLGRTTSGTLKLDADQRGLNFSVQLPDSEYANHVHENVKRGDLAGCSFAFLLSPDDQTYSQGDDGSITRHITGFSQLRDVSVVTRPAYPGTSIDARGMNEATAETRAAVERLTVNRAKTQSQVFAMTAEFVREQLSVPLFWDSKGTPRPFEEQRKLMQMATDYFEMRSRGLNVEIRRDENNWPSIDYTAMHQADMAKHLSRRRKILSWD